MRTHTRILFLVCLILVFRAAPLKADYAWIPKSGNLELKVGGNYFLTNTNFDYQSTRTSLFYNGHTTSLSTFRFLIEPEFSPAPGFSTFAKVNYLASGLSDRDVTGSPTVLNASGLGDLLLGVKANIVKNLPLITLEANVKIPTYSYYVSSFDELLQGDGNVDVGVMVHGGFRANRFYFDLSPGLLFRFSGYSSAFTLKALAGTKVSHFYGYLFANLLASFSDNVLFDTSLAVHDAPGAGGSYALLAGGPTVFSMGAKLGVEFIKNYSAELHFEQAVAGHRAADFVQTGLDLVMRFDLNPQDNRVKIHEIPFETEQIDPSITQDPKTPPKESPEPPQTTEDPEGPPLPPPPPPTDLKDSQ
jgi:hypothetical protein